jgi:hypothetical protein
LSLNKLFQQVDSCCGVVTFAFELGDDPILTVDLPPAEDKVLLGSGQKIKKPGTVHVMNPPLCGEIRRCIPAPRPTNARE